MGGRDLALDELHPLDGHGQYLALVHEAQRSSCGFVRGVSLGLNNRTAACWLGCQQSYLPCDGPCLFWSGVPPWKALCLRSKPGKEDALRRCNVASRADCNFSTVLPHCVLMLHGEMEGLQKRSFWEYGGGRLWLKTAIGSPCFILA